MSAMRYFIIKVRMQLWDFLLDLLTSLCAERSTFLHLRVRRLLFLHRLNSHNELHSVSAMQSQCHIIGNAIPLKVLEQENTFQEQLELNCMFCFVCYSINVFVWDALWEKQHKSYRTQWREMLHCTNSSEYPLLAVYAERELVSMQPQIIFLISCT